LNYSNNAILQRRFLEISCSLSDRYPLIFEDLVSVTVSLVCKIFEHLYSIVSFAWSIVLSLSLRRSVSCSFSFIQSSSRTHSIIHLSLSLSFSLFLFFYFTQKRTHSLLLLFSPVLSVGLFVAQLVSFSLSLSLSLSRSLSLSFSLKLSLTPK